jgi:VWFA-related protein
VPSLARPCKLRVDHLRRIDDAIPVEGFRYSGWRALLTQAEPISKLGGIKVTRSHWLFAVLILLPIPGFAQQSSASAPASSASATQSSAGEDPNVTIDVVVTDKSGTPIRGLQKQDFTLLDDKQPQILTSFRAVDFDAGTPAPQMELVLVVDAINADPLKTDHEREGIKKFLQRNGGKLAQPVSLVVLSDSGPKFPHGASTDGNALAALLDQYATGLRTINRSQGIYGVFERFQMSIKALNSVTAYEASKPGRKLVIWVSPGWPLLSNGASDITTKDQQHIFNSIVEASTKMRLGHITLYNVEARGVAGTSVSQFSYYEQFLKGVKSSEQAYPADLSLQVLAVQTGGLVLNRSNDLPSAIAEDIAKGARDARSFYVLSFPASRADRANEYHALEVKLGKPGLTARTRTGYYAQP